ncbi:MAG: hypothetical protein Q4G44_03050 [Alcaligenaceae bacterium]|nr:hypothetical protein [Alcaligenaceae bacterium]
MNIFPVMTNIIEKPNSLGFALASIVDGSVTELRHLEDILGRDYYVITHDVQVFSEEIIDKLFSHPKIIVTSNELYDDADLVCFGILADGKFREL